jgi:hypothetical protein
LPIRSRIRIHLKVSLDLIVQFDRLSYKNLHYFLWI